VEPKGLLRECGIEVPASPTIRYPPCGAKPASPPLHEHLERLASISCDLRGDREIAFHGAEDLTPSGTYSEADAVKAREGPSLTVKPVKPQVADPRWGVRSGHSFERKALN
jgi:hypothetical protein